MCCAVSLSDTCFAVVLTRAGVRYTGVTRQSGVHMSCGDDSYSLGPPDSVLGENVHA
jgi:hypothetical protein